MTADVRVIPAPDLRDQRRAFVLAIVPALEPIDEARVDRELWEILRWMIDGVGAPWTVADLEATGRLFRVGAVGDR